MPCNDAKSDVRDGDTLYFRFVRVYGPGQTGHISAPYVAGIFCVVSVQTGPVLTFSDGTEMVGGSEAMIIPADGSLLDELHQFLQ
jgi:hypothetical protein